MNRMILTIGKGQGGKHQVMAQGVARVGLGSVGAGKGLGVGDSWPKTREYSLFFDRT